MLGSKYDASIFEHRVERRVARLKQWSNLDPGFAFFRADSDCVLHKGATNRPAGPQNSLEARFIPTYVSHDAAAARQVRLLMGRHALGAFVPFLCTGD